MTEYILLDEDFKDFPIGEFPYDKNHSAMGEYHFIHYPGYYGKWYDPVCNHTYNDRVHHGLLLNIMENIIWNRCVSAMTSHTALFRCLQVATGSGGITL